MVFISKKIKTTTLLSADIKSFALN